jgi:hypothetical protein
MSKLTRRMTVMTDTGLSSVGQIIAWTVVGNANNGGTMNIAAIYGVGTADDARHRTASAGASIIYLRSQEAQTASSECRFRPCVGWLEH